MRDIAPASDVVVSDQRDAQIEELARRLSEAEAALEAMISGQVDAVADPRTAAPVLLHEAQDALRRSEERYRDLVSKSPAIVCELAPDGTTLFVNDRITTILGFRASDLIGKDWWAALVPDEQRGRATTLWRYLLRGTVSELEIAVVAADGSQRRIEWNCANRYGADGTLESVVAFGIDVTERKQAEETGQRLAAEQAARSMAERAELQAKLLAEASRALGSSLDYETTLTRVADYVVPTLGDWCAVDILGDDGTVRRLAARHSDPARVEVAANLRRQFPPDPAAPRGVPRVLRTGEAEFYPDIAELLAATARDSNHLDLLRGLGLRSAIIVPVKARERTIGAITLASAESGRRYDETDLRVAEDLAYRVAVAVENSRLYQEAHAARADAERARADAEQANKAKSDFLASMSHELRTPLNAIGGYVQLLWEGLPGPVNEKQREYLSRARRSQAHLLGLINNVLNFAKLEAGQLQYEITLVPLRESLAEVDDLIAPQVRAKGLSYDIQVCKTNVIMRADRAKVRQILLNLVSNAVKFTAPGGNVAIDCGMRGSDAFIVVRDSGIGIAPERLGDVFEPFVQLEKGASREGTGLGLSISRELARAMQGDLTVESELGKGSAFTLTLPVAADSATSDAATADAATRDAARCAAGSERPDGLAQSG